MKIRNILLGATVMCTAVAVMAAETYKEAWTKGLKEYKAKKYKEAVVTLGEAAKLAKTPAEKYTSMCHQGYALQRSRKYNEAAKVFDDLMKVDKLSVPQKDNAFNQYMHNIYWSRKYKDLFAITAKTMADDKATNAMKTSGAYLSCLASGNSRKYADKINYAKKLIELNSKGVWHSRGLIYQAQALRGQKKFEAAMNLLPKEVIVKMHPHRQGEAYLERGNIKAGIKKYSEAVIEYIVVYELPKGHPTHKATAIVQTIEVLNSAGTPEAAAVWIERVDGIKNQYWKGRGQLRAAQLLEKQGKLEAAKKQWEACAKTGSWWRKLAKKQAATIDKKLKAKK
jgi:tetratricopeptide (TPR) repeat protein